MSREKIGGRRRSAEETELRIFRAAEGVFGQKGYLDATVADIVDRARVSRGTFYLYFKNKDDVFAKLVSDVVNDLFAVSATPRHGTLRERVEAANRAYLKAFARHRHVLRCLFQVVTFNRDLATLHNELRTKFIERIRRHLEKNMARGLCPPMNPEVTSYALGLMVEWVAYSWLCAGFEPRPGCFDFEAVVTELTALWCRAVYRHGEGLLAPGASAEAGPTDHPH